jgi:hypothetical protein
MDEFAKYRDMRDRGDTPQTIYLRAKEDELGLMVNIRMLRELFGLSLAEAKEVWVVAEGLGEDINDYQGRMADDLERALEIVEQESSEQESRSRLGWLVWPALILFSVAGVVLPYWPVKWLSQWLFDYAIAPWQYAGGFVGLIVFLVFCEMRRRCRAGPDVESVGDKNPFASKRCVVAFLAMCGTAFCAISVTYAVVDDVPLRKLPLAILGQGLVSALYAGWILDAIDSFASEQFRQIVARLSLIKLVILGALICIITLAAACSSLLLVHLALWAFPVLLDVDLAIIAIVFGSVSYCVPPLLVIWLARRCRSRKSTPAD